MLSDIIVGVLMDLVGSSAEKPLSIGNLLAASLNGFTCAQPASQEFISYASAIQAGTFAITIGKRTYDHRDSPTKSADIKLDTAVTVVQHAIGFGCGYVAGYLTK